MKYISASVLLLCISCAPHYYHPKLTPEQRSYLDAALAQPTTFVAHAKESNQVWGRIQAFIAQASPMKIQVATDYVIETYNPNALSGGWCGYSATRAPLSDSVKFSVRCFHQNRDDGSEGAAYLNQTVNQNAHICAYYAVTGKDAPSSLIQ